MDKIKIRCTTGYTMNIDDMDWYPSKLKKHSDLEIERIVQSIIDDGFLFPICIGKVDDKNYIIDGECTYNALQELKYRGYEIPEIPVYFVRCNEETIKKMILIGTSTNHCVTKYSLKEFFPDENSLKQLAFNEGTLIDFHNVCDIDVYLSDISKNTKDKYIEAFKMGEI